MHGVEQEVVARRLDACCSTRSSTRPPRSTRRGCSTCSRPTSAACRSCSAARRAAPRRARAARPAREPAARGRAGRAGPARPLLSTGSLPGRRLRSRAWWSRPRSAAETEALGGAARGRRSAPATSSRSPASSAPARRRSSAARAARSASTAPVIEPDVHDRPPLRRARSGRASRPLPRSTGSAPEEWGDLEPYFDGTIAFVEWPEHARRLAAAGARGREPGARRRVAPPDQDRQ